MKKILVTGAHGQLGTEFNFLTSLAETNNFVFADRNVLDITDTESVTELFNREKFFAVINCAGYTAVDKAEIEKDMAFAINSTAAGNLALVALKTGARFIHFSTDFVFDGKSSIPYNEEDKTKALSVYGKSKLAGEEFVLKNNSDAVLIRTSWLYSSFGNNFLKTILRLANERDQLKIIFDQVGTPTYARDLAEAILKIVSADEWKPGIYHYSNEGTASWYDFAVAIKHISGFNTPILPIETMEYPTPAERPKYSVLNKKKIKTTFGMEVPYWRDSLQRCIARLK